MIGIVFLRVVAVKHRLCKAHDAAYCYRRSVVCVSSCCSHPSSMSCLKRLNQAKYAVWGLDRLRWDQGTIHILDGGRYYPEDLAGASSGPLQSTGVSSVSRSHSLDDSSNAAFRCQYCSNFLSHLHASRLHLTLSTHMSAK